MDLDLENGDGDGGGGGNNNDDAVTVDLRCPDPADPHNKEERQPFTWLRAAPYIAATLASVALFAISLVLICRSCTPGEVAGRGHHSRSIKYSDETTECHWGVVLFPIALLVMAATVGFTGASCGLSLDCSPRLEADR